MDEKGSTLGRSGGYIVPTAIRPKEKDMFYFIATIMAASHGRPDVLLE